MPTPDEVLGRYQQSFSQDERALLARYMLRLARADDSALDGLLFVVNDENDSQIRLEIVRFLAARHSLKAVNTLAKQMFDPDPRVRAHAAIGVARYGDPWTLAPFVASILDALDDGATRSYAETALRTVAGRAPDRITHSERERVRRGESADTIWPDHFVLRERSVY